MVDHHTVPPAEHAPGRGRVGPAPREVDSVDRRPRHALWWLLVAAALPWLTVAVLVVADRAS